MSEPPVYTPPEELKWGEAQVQQGEQSEGQPAAYSPGQPGQPGAYPQGQPVAYPQGPTAAYSQGQPGQPGAYPQGQPGQPGAYPQGQPVAYPQGQPYYPQGQPVVYQQGQPGVYQPGQQQVVITQPGNATHVYHTGSNQGCCGGTTIAEHYNEKAGFATGVTHLIIGVLSLILGGVTYAFPVVQVGYGIWSAIIFYIPTGILGISSKNKNSCVIIAYMVFAILSALHAIGMFTYEITAAAVLSSYIQCYNSYIGYSFTRHCNIYRSTGAIAVHSILALLGLVEFIVAIVSAVYCCRGSACCCAPPPTNQGVGATTTTTTTVQYAQPQAQPMAVVVGPPANQATGPKLA